LIPLVRLFCQQPRHDAPQPFRHVLAKLRQRLGRFVAVGKNNFNEGVLFEWRAAGQQVIQGAAQAIQIGADVDGVGVARLLGSNVVGRAQDTSGLGLHGGSMRVGNGVDAAILALHLLEACQTHVEQLDQAPLSGPEQVGGLDIAVDQAALEGVLQAHRPLSDGVAGLA
jgi:hypothetical protein